MISRPWQPNAGFAIVGTTVNRGAQCALPLSGGPRCRPVCELRQARTRIATQRTVSLFDFLAFTLRGPMSGASKRSLWLFRPTTEDLIELLHRSGFGEINHLSSAEAQRTCFLQRSDRLRARI